METESVIHTHEFDLVSMRNQVRIVSLYLCVFHLNDFKTVIQIRSQVKTWIHTLLAKYVGRGTKFSRFQLIDFEE